MTAVLKIRRCSHPSCSSRADHRAWQVLDRADELLSDYYTFEDAREAIGFWLKAERAEVLHGWDKACGDIVRLAPLIREIESADRITS